MAQEGAPNSVNTEHTRFLEIASRQSITRSRLTIVSTVLLLILLSLIVSMISHVFLSMSVYSYTIGDYQASEKAAGRAFWWEARGVNPVAWLRERRQPADTAWMTWALKGIAIFKQGRIAEAYPYLSYAATQVRPDMASPSKSDVLLLDVLLSAGIAAVKLGYYEEACIYLRRAAKYKARQTEARYYLGEALHGMGNNEAADTVWRDIVKSGEEPWSSKARERLRSIRRR